MVAVLGTSGAGSPGVPPDREGELGTKTTYSGSTEELINSGDEEKKEGWWFKIHTRYKFVGKAYE